MIKYYGIQFENGEFYLQFFPKKEMAEHIVKGCKITDCKVVQVAIKPMRKGGRE